MTELGLGDAWVSMAGPGPAAQRQALAGLRVGPERSSVDHGLTGTDRERPGQRDAVTRSAVSRAAGSGAWGVPP